MEQLVGITLWLLFLLLAGQAIFVLRFVAALARHRRELLPDDQCPLAVVVLCLRGSDPFLARCLGAITRQDYPQFLVKAIVDHPADPAWRIVEQARRENPDCRLTLEPRVKRLETCSLKCSSIVQAIESLEPAYEIAAQLDADTIPHSTWLRELATALADEKVGAATGNRWYTPDDLAWGAWVRAAWNAAAIVQMFWYRIAWGGTLAVKTQAIREAGLLDRWSHAFCEDTMLFSRLRQFGWRVDFVPSLMMVNRETCDLENFLSWVRRQLVTARLYHPGWSAVLGHGLATTGALAGTAVLAAIAIGKGDFDDAAWLVGGFVAYQMVVLMLLVPIDWSVRKIMIARGDLPGRWTFGKLVLQVASVLVTQLVYPVALVSAAFVRRVSWRQASYQIDGPWNIRLLDETPYSCPAEDAGSRASL